jgi:hypothetical protein
MEAGSVPADDDRRISGLPSAGDGGRQAAPKKSAAPASRMGGVSSSEVAVVRVRVMGYGRAGWWGRLGKVA